MNSAMRATVMGGILLLALSDALATGQETSPAPWRTDVTAAREAAVQQGRPCVILLFVDSF